MPLLTTGAGAYAAIGGGGGGGFAITYKDTSNVNTNVAVTDYGTRVWNSGQVLVVAAMGISNNPASTISGIAAGANTLTFINRTSVGNFGATVEVWATTGNVADSGGNITVTYSSSPNSFGIPSSIGVFSVSTTTPTPGTAVGVTSGSVASISATGVNIPAGGGAIVAICTNNSGSSFASWTNAATDQVTSTNSMNQVVGHTTTTGASVTVTANMSPNDAAALVVVPWAS